MESRQEARCSLHLCQISTVFPPESQPLSYSAEETPSVPQQHCWSKHKEDPHIFSWKSCRTCRNISPLIFSLWIRDGAVQCFPGSWSREYFKGPIRKKTLLLALAGDIAQVLKVPDPSGKMLLALNSLDHALGFLKGMGNSRWYA